MILQRLFFFAIVLSALAIAYQACSRQGKPNSNQISREKFVNLYVDLLIASEGGAFNGKDSTAGFIRRDSLLNKYGMSETSFKTTLDSYGNDLTIWKEFFDEVMKKLDTPQKGERAPERP